MECEYKKVSKGTPRSSALQDGNKICSATVASKAVGLSYDYYILNNNQSSQFIVPWCL